MYYFETHLHSSGCSGCARNTSVEMVLAAKESGYAGVIFTNHFPIGNTAVNRELPWEEFFGAYREDYLKAKKAGEEIGVTVLFGLEKGYGGGKEALIYGIDPDVMLTEPRLLTMDLPELSAFVRKNNGWIVAAHPFRHRGYIPNPDEEPNPDLFDALEVYNRGNTAEDNRKACEYALRVGLPVTSGGDIHVNNQFLGSGLAFYEPISDNRQLVDVLQDGRYQLLIDGSPTDPNEFIKHYKTP